MTVALGDHERPQTFVNGRIHAGEPSKVTFAIVVWSAT